MKLNIKYFYVLPIIFLSLMACQELEEVRMKAPDQVVPPTINAPADGSVIPISKDNASENAMTIRFTRTDYGLEIGPTYTVEIDMKDGDFTGSLELGTSTKDTFAITQGALNDKLLTLGLAPESEGEFDLRISSSTTDSMDVYISNVMSYKATPFATTFTSIYMIGAPVGGWDPAKAVEMASIGEFGKHETIALFTNDNGLNFRFFNEPDWGASLGGYDVFPNYPTDLLEVAAGDGDPNFNFIGTPGWYKIETDQTTGTITMTPVEEPLMYLTGDATHGWGWDDPVTSLNWVGHQIWEGDVTFTKDGAFRCFEQKDWGPVGYGHDVITNFDSSFIIIAADHGDPNWYFVAESGTYHVIVDKRMSTMTISPK